MYAVYMQGSRVAHLPNMCLCELVCVCTCGVSIKLLYLMILENSEQAAFECLLQKQKSRIFSISAQLHMACAFRRTAKHMLWPAFFVLRACEKSTSHLYSRLSLTRQTCTNGLTDLPAGMAPVTGRELHRT